MLSKPTFRNDEQYFRRRFHGCDEWEQAVAFFSGRWATETLVSLAVQIMHDSAEAVAAAADAVVARKGLLLGLLAQWNRVTAKQELLPELQTTNALVASLAIGGPRSMAVRDYIAVFEDRVHHRSKLQQSLYGYAEGTANQRSEFESVYNAKLIQENLPVDSVLIELTIYRRTDFRAFNEEDIAPRYYVALVLEGGTGRQKLVELGAVDQVDRLVRTEVALGEYIDPTKQEQVAEARLGIIGNNLYTLLFTPLESLIGTASLVYLCPEGEVGLISFEVLRGPDGRYLAERFTFAYVTSSRDVLAFSKESGTHGTHGDVVIFADPDYDKASFQIEPASPTDSPAISGLSLFFREHRWDRLQHTRYEASEIRAQMPGRTVEVFSGEDARKGKIKNLASSKILHFATHGFFLARDDLRWLFLIKTAGSKPLKTRIIHLERRARLALPRCFVRALRLLVRTLRSVRRSRVTSIMEFSLQLRSAG